MAVEGTLAAGGGGELLAALTEQGRTGILELTLGELSRKFVYRGGEIIYLISDERTEKLPLRMVARGRASKETVIEAAKSGDNLRTALVDAGAYSLCDQEFAVSDVPLTSVDTVPDDSSS